MALAPPRGWSVTSAQFEKSAAEVAQCPQPDVPELAIAGRSNVGKSSLLNALTRQRKLARVSRTPGRTQLLNFFALKLQGPNNRRCALRLCDLPGYGFAAAHKSVREGFAPMIESYLEARPSLRALVLLVDARRGVGKLDRAMLGFLAARRLPSLLVATKTDKLGASALGLARRQLAASLDVHSQDVLLTSATKGVGLEGDDGLVAALAELAGSAELAATSP